MRKTENAIRLLQLPRLPYGLRVAACLLGIGLCLATGAARAGDDDDEDDNAPIEDKIMRNIMSGIGGTNMDNKGINYRERSPLVMPRSADLPPPQTAAKTKTAPNWPNDPTVAARKAAAAANSERKKTDLESAMPLTPSELAPKKTRAAREATVQQPGANDGTQGGNAGGPMLAPSQLGFSSGMMGSMFKGNAPEAAKFKGEPTREDLTQPPVGYQTPSPDFAYGTGPAVPIDKQTNGNGVAPDMTPSK